MIKQVYVREKENVPAELGTFRVQGFDYKLYSSSCLQTGIALHGLKGLL